MAGFSEGFQAGASVRNARDERRRLAEERNQELTRMGYSFENGKMTVRPDSMAEQEQLAAKEAVQLAKALQGKLAAQSTDQAFEDFSLTGDAKYLQSALDSDPVLKNAWAQRGVQFVSNLDFENDSSLLSKSGFSPSMYDTAEKRDVIRKGAYKIYDGKDWSIGLANNAMAETGAFKRLGQRRAQPALDNHKQFVSLLSGPKVDAHTAEGHKYEKEIMTAAEKYNVPPNLIAAMIHQESRNNPTAISPKGAGGLMQLMPETAKELGVTDVHNPAQNIDAGTNYLSQMLDKYGGDVQMALAAYNAGPGNVDKYGGVPPFGETQNYISNIMSNLDRGEQYYSRTADDTINTILNHRRAIANAAQGTTNEIVDRAADREDTKVGQEDQRIALADRAASQTDRQLDQKDIELAQADEDRAVKLLEIQTKLKTDGQTATQKDLNRAAEVTDGMLEEFGGEENFFNTDFSDPKEYRDAYKSIVQIEKLEGTQLSEADKKTITDLRALLALGDPASKLTGNETGLIDNTLGNMKKYYSDSVKGVAAKSSYNAFRNSVRNALFGSALTEGEIKAFNEAFGNLGNQLGPVLEMFQTALSQVDAKLDSTANMMNPYSAKVRLGADQAKIDEIRKGLQQRIDYLTALSKGKTDAEEFLRNAGLSGKQKTGTPRYTDEEANALMDEAFKD